MGTSESPGEEQHDQEELAVCVCKTMNVVWSLSDTEV